MGVLYSVQGRRNVTLEISTLLDNLLVRDVNERGENVFSRLRLEGVKYRRKPELRAGITTNPLSNHLKVSLNVFGLPHLTEQLLTISSYFTYGSTSLMLSFPHLTMSLHRTRK